MYFYTLWTRELSMSEDDWALIISKILNTSIFSLEGKNSFYQEYEGRLKLKASMKGLIIQSELPTLHLDRSLRNLSISQSLDFTQHYNSAIKFRI